MKEIFAFREDDRKYIKYSLSVKEIEILSDYLNKRFPGNTQILCYFDFENNLLAAQVFADFDNRNFTWELTPEEFE